MSMETRLARSAAVEAEETDRQHVGVCRDCTAATKANKPARRCEQGQQLATDAYELRREARRQAKLDEAPNPWQATLFGQGELFGDE